MPHQINIDELKTLIAAKVRDLKLDDILDTNALEEVKNRVLGVYKHDHAKSNIPEMIPEAVIPNGMGDTEKGLAPGGYGTEINTGNTMQDMSSIEKVNIPGDYTQQPGQNVDAGTTGNIPEYTPELPSFLHKIEPAKIIVFSQNELSEGGENLSNKPLRTFEDPDIKKSMRDFWVDKGQKRAEVYMVKLEKIGELNFDYANGTTQFTEKRFDPDFEMQAKYKENPYMNNAGPAKPGELDINGQPNVMAQIGSSVDLQQVVTDIVMNILRNQLITNNTRAVNGESSYNKIMNKEEGFGYDTTQAVKPMEESFNLKMSDLVNDFEKIDAPQDLKEAIEKNDRTLLVKENEEVQEWVLNGKKYYTPVNKISTRKCYFKS